MQPIPNGAPKVRADKLLIPKKVLRYVWSAKPGCKPVVMLRVWSYIATPAGVRSDGEASGAKLLAEAFEELAGMPVRLPLASTAQVATAGMVREYDLNVAGLGSVRTFFSREGTYHV